MKALLAAAATALAIVATPAAAVIIDFEDQVDNSIVAGALVYPDATFTSSTGSFAINGANVGKDICTVTDDFTCSGTLFVAFNSAVNALSFQSVGDDLVSTLFIKVFHASGTTDTTSFSDGILTSLETHDLSAFTGVTGLEIFSDDPSGLAYDNFRFTPADARIPEPATWAMLIVGFGLVGAAARRSTSALANA